MVCENKKIGATGIEMKAGDVVALKGSWFVMLATVSYTSHVAIAIDENNVIEAVPSGIRVRTLATCIADAKEAHLYSAPDVFTKEQMEEIKIFSKKLEMEGVGYSFTRAGYSGLKYILRNFFVLLTFVNVILALIYGEADVFWWLAAASFFLGLPLSYLVGMTLCVNKMIDNFKLPDCFKTGTKKRFCSSLVLEIDEKFFKSIKVASKITEPRPKDIVAACRRAGWKERKLK